MSQGPEANLWQSMRKSLKAAPFNPTRIENRHGGGIPDVEMQWPTGSAFVELKAPRSTPKLSSENLKVRPHLFSFSEQVWSDAMFKGLTCTALMSECQDAEFCSHLQSASLASKDQKAWHARRFANGGVSFFLQSTARQRSKRLFSPIILPDTSTLVLGLVCESDDWGVVLYALRLAAEMHALRALVQEP